MSNDPGILWLALDNIGGSQIGHHTKLRYVRNDTGVEPHLTSQNS